MPEKNELKPWLKPQQWCIPPEASADFVWRMEDVLDVYRRPYDPKRPVVGLDEKPVQLLSDPPGLPAQPPVPAPAPAPAPRGRAARAARAARQDYRYERCGTANVFCAFEPLGNWRTLEVTDRRTTGDFAQFVRSLVDGRYKDTDRLVLVMDNLNTHTPASLYETFGAAEARRLTAKLEIHYTPKHGSWLNVAEIELSALGRRLPPRVGRNAAALATFTAAVARERNEASAGCDWQFTTADARIKLKRLYPAIQRR